MDALNPKCWLCKIMQTPLLVCWWPAALSVRKQKSSIWDIWSVLTFSFFLASEILGCAECLAVLILAPTAAGEAFSVSSFQHFSVQLIAFKQQLAWAQWNTTAVLRGRDIITRDNQRGMEEQIPSNRINPAGDRSQGERKGLARGKSKALILYFTASVPDFSAPFSSHTHTHTSKNRYKKK